MAMNEIEKLERKIAKTERKLDRLNTQLAYHEVTRVSREISKLFDVRFVRGGFDCKRRHIVIPVEEPETVRDIKKVHVNFIQRKDEPDEIPFRTTLRSVKDGFVIESKKGYDILVESEGWDGSEYYLSGKYIRK